MRRWRKAASAAFLLATLIILTAHQQDKLPGGRQLNAILQESKFGGFSLGNSESVAGIEAHHKSEQEADDTRPLPPPVPPPVPPIPETAQEALENGQPLKEVDALLTLTNSPPPSLPPPLSPPELQSSETVQIPLEGLQLITENAQPPDSNAPLDPSNAPPFHPEYTFQADLPLELPIEVLTRCSTQRPHNHPSSASPPYPIYATFMATRNPSLHDPYYLAIHSLLYRILWSPISRTHSYGFVVFVGPWVTAEQRTLLTGAGAEVRELPELEWNPPGQSIQPRWRDLFAKLHLWNQTDFSKILFLDADAFPVANIDAMLELAPVQQCRRDRLSPDDEIDLDLTEGSASACEPYVLAGVPQSQSSPAINVGSMVLSPSARMHARLLQNYRKFDRYDVRMAEQAFLNWQFGVEGAFPATVLGREWGAVFPQEGEEGALKVVHEKLWAAEGGWLRRVWVEGWVEMTRYYMGREFESVRGMDGVV